VTLTRPGPRPAQAQAPAAGPRVPLSDILVDEEIEQAVVDTVRSGWWSMGPRVEEFELAFADFCGADSAFAVSNGTAALHLALLAVGCGPGDEVILPSLNFVAAANTIVHTGATPVFCDIQGTHNLNLDVRDLEAAITPATRALVLLHYGGHPCDVDAVLELARARGIVVIEDAAHALGSFWNGRHCGTFGDIGCFSFFSNKNLPTGEGGMVVTNDGELAERIRLLRSHGMTTLTWDRQRGHAHSYDVVAHGYNYRLDEIRAAIGLVELRRLPANNAERARLVECYRTALDGLVGIEMPFAPRDLAESSHHLAVIVIPEGHQRDAFRTALAEAGIQTSVHYPPIHSFTAYSGAEPSRALPVTDAVAPRLVTLPLFAHMTVEQASAVVSAALNAAA
jgi:dTDP-4-amino-4,6-dideoxygalactose transaminase